MTMEMEGVAFTMPPIVYSNCLSKKDLIPEQSKENKDCKMLENKVTGNSIKWKMECKTEAGKSLSIGKITYNKTTAKGEIKVVTSNMTMISKLNGRYTGKCK